MPTCVAFGCSNRSKKKNPGTTFHKFPKKTQLREAWIKACSRQNWMPSEWSHLCSQHFSEDQLDRTSLVCVRLRENAVPNIFSTLPLYLQKTEKSGRPSMETEQPMTSAIPEETMLDKENTNLCSSEPPQQNTTEKYHCKTPLQNARTRMNSESSTTLMCDAATSPIKSTLVCDAATSPFKIDSTDKILKRRLQECEYMNTEYRKKIRMLQQQNRRCNSRIKKLTSLFEELKQKQFMEDSAIQVLRKMAGPNEEFLTRQLSKFKNERVPNAYSPQLRAFALTLHFYSPRAYEYVRETFNTCLPHTRTISRWYQKVNALPGFTSEAFKALADKVNSSSQALVFSLVYDEMAIMKHVEFDGKVFHGYVDVGTEVDDASLPVAKEALVFMVVCVNDRWKVPIGYFLTDGMNAMQRANLILQGLSLLHEQNVRVVSLTFDGLPANFSAVSHLGCNFDPDSLATHFKHPETGEYIFVLLDPCHMLKCVRNAFGDKKSLVDGEGNFIDWKYVEQLHYLQEKEGLNLANKLRGSHIKYYKQKMKVRLAAQTFSKSVSDAIRFCNNELALPEFKGCEPTIKFINVFNDLFDVLNSRSRMQQGFKKAISHTNVAKVEKRLTEIEQYIYSLRVSKNGERVIDSSRKTGFIGFLVCIQSVKAMFLSLVQTQKLLTYLPVYKLSQDHVELFFQSVRSHGGHNNNPTARQFKSAYKKLLIKSEIKSTSGGNCVPLEQLSILNVSNDRKPEDVINNTSAGYRALEDEPVVATDPAFDHDYLFDAGSLTLFSEHVVYYIAGFIVRKLTESVKCDVCVEALYSTTPLFTHSLISYKTRGGLVHPSSDVYRICKTCETVFRRNVCLDGGSFLKKTHGILHTEIEVLRTLSNQTLFSVLHEHTFDQEPLENHICHLLRAVVKRYLATRFMYWGKNVVLKGESLRQMYTKIILFRGE